MRRPTLVYILVLLACIAGVYVIIERGSSLVAPQDLSGQWLVIGDAAEPDASLELGPSVFIEQSGRFARFSFAGGLKINMKMALPTEPGESTSRQAVETRFKGRGWRLTILGAGAEGPLVCRLGGPQRHTFTMVRLNPEVDEVLTDISPVTPGTQPDGVLAIDAGTDEP